MAELDPEKVGTSGFDPGTGSPLSQEVRNTLLKKSIIDKSVFRNEILESENRKKQLDAQNASVIQDQERALLGFGSNIQALRADIGRLGTGLASIALLLQQDGIEEQSRIRLDQEKQRRLTERQIRIGKESEIEQNIQNALVKPVEQLTPKVNDVFGKIGTALGILFGGWLTNQVVQAIRASEEGNTKLFNDIKFNIIKNLGIVGGGLLAIRAGFSLVKATIGRIASGLTRLLIAKPLAIASALIRVPFGIGSKKPPSTTKPGKGSGLGLGKLLTGISVAMNLKNKEYVDSVLGALSLFSRAPGPIGLVAKVAGVAFTLDEIVEAFGKNIFGDERDKIINDAAQAAKKEIQKITKSSSSTAKPAPKKEPTPPISSPKPAPSSTTSIPPAAPPVAQPQTPMMGEQQTTPVLTPDMIAKFEQAWQYRNNPFARNQIEGVWDKMSPEQKQQAKDWAKSKGYDWKEMKLPDAPVPASAQSSSQSSEVSISPAQVSPPPKQPTQVGELPPAQPSITMIKTSNNANQQANVPLTSGALTDVPFINSANPDNFYVLYSQLNYNVVT
jgi:hypothetical protein